MKKFLFLLLPLFSMLVAFTPKPTPEIPADVKALLDKNTCTTCHHIERKMVGPSWMMIAAKKYSKKRIIALTKKPEPGNWPGYAPMAALPNVPKAEMNKIADWLVALGNQ